MFELKKTIEAALFMSPKPLSIEQLSEISREKDLQQLIDAVNELKHEYNERNTALEISLEENHVKMQLKPEMEEKVIHLAAASEFGKGVMKTLAYIAFKQPVKQSQIIKFRSTKAYEEIKLLLEKGFISRERDGLTFQVKTTKKFLQHFGKDSVALKPNPDFNKEESQETESE